MKKRSFPPLAAVLFMAAALTAAPFLCGVAPSAAQSDDAYGKACLAKGGILHIALRW